jgi:hypothetical protein
MPNIGGRVGTIIYLFRTYLLKHFFFPSHLLGHEKSDINHDEIIENYMKTYK